MAPRELSRVAFNLASWIAAYVSRLLVKLELPIYCAFCMYIYSSFLRGALPGRYDDIFFVNRPRIFFTGIAGGR